MIRTLAAARVTLGMLFVSHALAAPESVSPDGSPVATSGAPIFSSSSTGAPNPGQSEMNFVVRLSDPSLAAKMGPNALRNPNRMSADAQRSYLSQLATKQDAVMASIRMLGGSELGRVSKVHNALMISISEDRIAEVARLTGVSKVRQLADFELDLSETVPYVGATTIQSTGLDGTGVRVAVIDSGIDYTHRNLGGAGTLEAFQAAYGTSPNSSENKTPDSQFPSDKVIGGYDFVGESWPNGELAPDPDPIDFQGHGTHVADIIAGQSTDGTHVGVAPGASVYGVKACSAVSSSCSGVALLQAMDFSLDPNGDNDISDAVDVINLSLGSSYGQREDDLSESVSIAARYGVIVVASAGNSGNRPYILGSPSSTPEAISVAQTQVPSAEQIALRIDQPANIAGNYPNTATLSFAPIDVLVSGQVANAGLACAPGAITTDVAGKIALVDRGVCAISLKVDAAAQKGAIGVLVGLNAPGDAITFSFGGGSTFVPSLVITQANANQIKSALTAGSVLATLDPANSIELVGSMVGSSSRGPNFSYAMIKPDIGAPGASLSAQAGSGSGELAFGGTSGAAPMVSGAAALLRQRLPTASVHEIKAMLMNAAETTIHTNPATSPGELAPITRIGGGELRVDRSAALTAAAWDAADPFAVGLSFGYQALTGTATLSKKVTIRNYRSSARSFSIARGFRYPSDATGTVISAPTTVSVPANGSASFTMSLRIDPRQLPDWTLGGARTGDGALLNLHEVDGYLTLSDANDRITLPWHVLPHKSAASKASKTTLNLGGAASANISVANTAGATTGIVDIFSLTATSPRLPASVLPKPGDNFAIIDLKAVGVRQLVYGGLNVIQFAANTWGWRAHTAYPAEFNVLIDSNNDGVDDYVVYNTELTGFAQTGQTVVTIRSLASGSSQTFFYLDADLNSANAILTTPAAAVGLTEGNTFSFKVCAADNYFTGASTDCTAKMVHTPNAPRFSAQADEVLVPAGSSTPFIVSHNPAANALDSQSGLLLMYRHAKPAFEAEALSITP